MSSIVFRCWLMCNKWRSVRRRRHPGLNSGRVMVMVMLLAGLAHSGLTAENKTRAPESAPDTSPKVLFETHCSACHSLELPRSQRLNRNTWRWVVDDMVNEFGATWLTEQQQRIIIDYLVKNYGPDRPRGQSSTK